MKLIQIEEEVATFYEKVNIEGNLSLQQNSYIVLDTKSYIVLNAKSYFVLNTKSFIVLDTQAYIVLDTKAFTIKLCVVFLIVILCKRIDGVMVNMVALLW